MGKFFLVLIWLYDERTVQSVGKNQELLTFCKNNWAF